MYNEIRKIGAILYFDGTGGLVRINGCALKGHIIHSKCSFQPREIFLNESDFDYGVFTHQAMGLFELIGHHQDGAIVAAFWKLIHEASDAIHDNPKHPLLHPLMFRTDGSAGDAARGNFLI